MQTRASKKLKQQHPEHPEPRANENQLVVQDCIFANVPNGVWQIIVDQDMLDVRCVNRASKTAFDNGKKHLILDSKWGDEIGKIAGRMLASCRSIETVTIQNMTRFEVFGVLNRLGALEELRAVSFTNLIMGPKTLGYVASGLASLTGLEALDLTLKDVDDNDDKDNSVTAAAIASMLRALTRLRSLHLNYAVFDPAVAASIGRLTSLRELAVGFRTCNSEDDPGVLASAVSQLTDLRKLELSSHYLSSPRIMASIAPSLGTSLRTLGLRGIWFDAAIVEYLAGLTSLTVDEHSQDLPLAQLRKLTALRTLRLHTQQWTTDGFLCPLSPISVLSLKWARPTSLLRLMIFTGLEQLSLSNMCYMDNADWVRLNTVLMRNPGLRSIDLSCVRSMPRIGSTLVAETLCSLTLLRTLNLSNNNFRTSVVDLLPPCLTDLDISGNGIDTPAEIFSLSRITGLRTLRIDNVLEAPSSSLSFVLRNVLPFLSDLRTFSARENGMTREHIASLMPAISRLPCLRKLDLSGNEISHDATLRLCREDEGLRNVAVMKSVYD